VTPEATSSRRARTTASSRVVTTKPVHRLDLARGHPHAVGSHLGATDLQQIARRCPFSAEVVVDVTRRGIARTACVDDQDGAA
jgi:hypothetical protein